MNISSRLKIVFLLLVTISLLTTLFVREGSQFLRAGEEHYNQATRAKDRNLKNAALAARLVQNQIEDLHGAAQAIAHLSPDQSVIQEKGRVEHFLNWQAHKLPSEGMLMLYPEDDGSFRLSSHSSNNESLIKAFEQTHWSLKSFGDNPILLSPISSQQFVIAFQITDSFEKPVIAATYLNFAENFFDGIDASSKLRLFSSLAAKELLAQSPNSLNAYVEVPGTGIGVYGEFKAQNFDRYELLLSRRTQALGLCILVMAIGFSFILFGRKDFSVDTLAGAKSEMEIRT